MDFAKLLREHALADIVTVDGVHYALGSRAQDVPGCVLISPQDYPAVMRTFLHKGFSQRYSKPYGALTGVAPWILFTYSLHHLTPTQKQVVSHSLAGTGGRKGLLRRWSGQKVGQSALLVPCMHEALVIAFFEQWRIPYTAEVLLRG